MEASTGGKFLQKFRLYETRSKFYLIGRDKSRTLWRVLKIDRTESVELGIEEDPTSYTEVECRELLWRIHEGNRLTGGLKFVTKCYGIVGFVKFLGPYYMVVITRRRKVGTICGHEIYSIGKSEMIAVPSAIVWPNVAYSRDENRYKCLLCSVDLSKDFFFSYSYNIMRSLQKNIIERNTGQVVYETMFVWNEFLTRSIRNHLKNTIWTVALIHGFFKQMEYISPERHLEGSCGDPGPLLGDQNVSLLDHLDYQGGGFQGGVSHHESPALDERPLVDPADAIPYLSTESLPFMNDQITCNSTKSVSASPDPSLKQAQEPRNIESDMQNDVVEQNGHSSNLEAEVTPVNYDDVHKSPEVTGAVLPQELPVSTGNDTSNIQPEVTQSDAYHGDSLLIENNTRDCQLNNSGDDEDEIPNSHVLQMENEAIKKSHDTSYGGENGSDDDHVNGRKSDSVASQDKNLNATGAPSTWEHPEQENPGDRNESSTPENQFDSPPERFATLERDTPSPDGRGSPERFERLERDTPLADGRASPRVRSPHASRPKMDSQHPAKDDLTHSQSPPERLQSRSPERRDSNRKRASPRESSPHAQNNSPIEKKNRRESRHGDRSPRQKSVSPRRRSTPPRRRSASPRRSSDKRRSSPRRDSPRRRDSRKDSPRRKESPRRRDSSRRKDSPRRRDRLRSRSPSRRTDSSRHRREHDRSRLRSPHSRDHHRRSPRRHSPRRRSPPSSHRHHSPKRHWSPPANRKTGLGKPGRNLFVAGFSYAITERDLEKKFGKYGRVTSARVVRDKRTGDSRGFGFLSLEKDEDADAAIRACDETEWNGRIILVEKSKAPTW